MNKTKYDVDDKEWSLLLFAVNTNAKKRSSLHSRYYAEACNEWRGHLRGFAPGQRSSEETSQHWRHCIGFDRPGNRTLDLPHR